MSLLDQITELERLDADYKLAYPGEETLFNLVDAYGFDELVRIATEAKGRRIIFQDGTDQGPDQVNWHYDDGPQV